MKTRGIIKSTIITALVLVVTTVISVQLMRLSVGEHVSTAFVFAIFIISLLTDGYIYGIISTVLGVLAINYLFTYPYWEFNFINTTNVISAVVMFTIAILMGMLTTRLKDYEVTKAESERERMRANLLRAVSHDIRTPLTTIYSACSTLREKRMVLTEKQQDEMLRSIQDDSEWLVRMVENLLSITRIDSGKVKISKTPVILDELIDSVMAKFLNRYPGQNVILKLPDEIVVVNIDAILIEQVLVNLLENCVIHAEGMTKIEFRVYVLHNRVVFEIADDGAGIPEEKMKNIFSGMSGAHRDNPDGKKRSAGIGLCVCDTIIRAHGGLITAENRKEGGAVFRFALERGDCR